METKKESKFFFVVLIVIVIVIIYIGLKFKKETAQPEGITTESFMQIIQKKKITIQDVKLDAEFLQTDKFKELKSPTELPVKAGEVGKSNLF